MHLNHYASQWYASKTYDVYTCPCSISVCKFKKKYYFEIENWPAYNNGIDNLKELIPLPVTILINLSLTSITLTSDNLSWGLHNEGKQKQGWF